MENIDNQMDSHQNHPHHYQIIVNNREKRVEQDTLTFEEIVNLAFDKVPDGPNIVFTITYEHGPKGNREGILPEGGVVMVKNGMEFDVQPTDKS